MKYTPKEILNNIIEYYEQNQMGKDTFTDRVLIGCKSGDVICDPRCPVHAACYSGLMHNPHNKYKLAKEKLAELEKLEWLEKLK